MNSLTIEVVLQADEAERLTEIAEKNGIGPEDLLACFAADLTDSERAGDENERRYAGVWMAQNKCRAW